jgi:GrpB-like predicted nucleotidyltransferase (UPF0157 family)
MARAMVRFRNGNTRGAIITAMGAVVITDADPGWADEYETVAARVRMVLGATLTRVDHIGSTSVPGLDAKDILDVQATVGEEALLDKAFGELTGAGWQARSPRRDHPVPGMPSGAGQWVKRGHRGVRRPQGPGVRPGLPADGEVGGPHRLGASWCIRMISAPGGPCPWRSSRRVLPPRP